MPCDGDIFYSKCIPNIFQLLVFPIDILVRLMDINVRSTSKMSQSNKRHCIYMCVLLIGLIYLMRDAIRMNWQFSN
jgi:hypothetical protein